MSKINKISLVCIIVPFCLSLAVTAQEVPGRAGRGGGMGMGAAGGRGMMGGGMGMAPVNVRRPDKAARLASLEEIQKQIEALKAAVEKAPVADPCIAELQGEALTTFTNQYNEERNAINAIRTELNNLRPASAGSGRGGRGGGAAGGLTTTVVTELINLATEENATRLVARLENLAKQIEEQNAIQKTLIVDGVYKLVRSSVNMFLVIGTEKAMLVDTGNPGDISPADVEAITKLPYIVVNTHAHPDHDGCNSAFKQIYITEADMEAARRASGDAELLPMKEGDVFDLGGKTLEVIEVPGHTYGSACLLIREDKLLISGDTANPNLLLTFTNIPIETFKKNIERLLDWKDQYTLSLAGHGGPFPVSYITDTIACAQEIIDGKAEQSAQPAQGGAAGGMRGGMFGGSTHTYGSIRITYNPNNIRENDN